MKKSFDVKINVDIKVYEEGLLIMKFVNLLKIYNFQILILINIIQ